MPIWAGIEDNLAEPSRVWCSRVKETDDWEPIRHIDCKRLNESKDKQLIPVESGRAMADITHGVIFYNFEKRPQRRLLPATWFVKEENPNDPKKQMLIPMPPRDAKITEELYQKAINAASTFGSGIDSVVKEDGVDLPPPEVEEKESGGSSSAYQVKVVKRGDGYYVMKKVEKGWFGKSYELQRGYGEYTVEGEEEELALGPVDHVVFVVHGIGEAMWTKGDAYVSSLCEQVTALRLAINKQKFKEWKEQNEQQIEKHEQPLPPPNRAEFVPIEWYDKIHSSSSSISKSLTLATLRTIPALREIANDVILDVLMYLTPNFCHDVLECVSEQIFETHQRFQQIHPDFTGGRGRCSLMGHSLGSVICWDLLSILKQEQEEEEESMRSQQQQEEDSSDAGITKGAGGDGDDRGNPEAAGGVVGYQHYAASGEGSNRQQGSWGPSLPQKLNKSLPFVPHCTIFLGSPVGLFLTLRGAHAVFDDLREKAAAGANDGGGDDEGKKTVPSISPFTLPSGSLRNIFHPSDPVAYRIEPLLLSQEVDPETLPPPRYLTRDGRDVRLHVKVQQLSENFRRNIKDSNAKVQELSDKIRKNIKDPNRSLSRFLNTVKEKSSPMLLLQQQPNNTEEEENGSTKRAKAAETTNEDGYRFPLGGTSNHRVDYQLQPGVIDNEYLSAVMSHTSYFVNTDVQDAILELTTNSNNKQV